MVHCLGWYRIMMSGMSGVWSLKLGDYLAGGFGSWKSGWFFLAIPQGFGDENDLPPCCWGALGGCIWIMNLGVMPIITGILNAPQAAGMFLQMLPMRLKSGWSFLAPSEFEMKMTSPFFGGVGFFPKTSGKGA